LGSASFRVARNPTTENSWVTAMSSVSPEQSHQSLLLNNQRYCQCEAGTKSRYCSTRATIDDGTRRTSTRTRCDLHSSGLGYPESRDVSPAFELVVVAPGGDTNIKNVRGLRTVLGGTGRQCQCHTHAEFHISMRGTSMLVGSGRRLD